MGIRHSSYLLAHTESSPFYLFAQNWAAWNTKIHKNSWLGEILWLASSGGEPNQKVFAANWSWVCNSKSFLKESERLKVHIWRHGTCFAFLHVICYFGETLPKLMSSFFLLLWLGCILTCKLVNLYSWHHSLMDDASTTTIHCLNLYGTKWHATVTNGNVKVLVNKPKRIWLQLFCIGVGTHPFWIMLMHLEWKLWLRRRVEGRETIAQ